MSETFAASPISQALVSTDAAKRSRSELHALMFLARYRNPRTRAGYAVTLKQWFRWCSEIGIDPLEATRNHVELFTRDLEMHGRTSATIAAKHNALMGFYKYAVIDRLIDDNPMVYVSRPKVPRESTNLGLTRPEVADILRAAADYPPRDKAIILFLAASGVRVSELIGLDVEDISTYEGQTLVAVRRKGGKRQQLPLHPKVAWQFSLTIGDRTRGPVFRTSTGNRIDRRVVARIITRAALEAGVTKRVTPHSFRHAYVTASLEAGRSERDVAASVGHADTRLVAYYDRGRDRLERNTTYSVMAFYEGAM